MRYAAAFVTGLIFAFGLALSGMTLPSKVVGFFDFSDGMTSWDPSLALVMAGATLVYMPVYRLVRNRAKPLFEACYRVPTNTVIDTRLVVGASLFGIGWGLAGFCPGPAVTSLGSFATEPLIFVAAMLVGMFAFQQFNKSNKDA